MHRNFKIAALAISVFIAAACSKNSGRDFSDKPFSAAGSTFATLQEAVNALSATDAGDGLRTLHLRANAKGDGAVVADGKNMYFAIDLGGFTYDLKGGCSIRIGEGSGLYISGSGGCIRRENAATKAADTYAVENGGDFLYFQNNASLVADKAILSRSEVTVADNFKGSIKGDIKLDKCIMTIYSVGEGIDVNALGVTGEGTCDAALDCQAADGKVTVASVSSNLQYPVWASNASNVEMPAGMTAHVHSYGEVETHYATCCVAEYETKVCSACGHVHTEYAVETGELGPCRPSDLIHVDAVLPQPPHAGCAEHWVCPHCLRTYSDAQARNLIENNSWIPASNFCIDSDLLYRYDDILDWRAAYESQQTKVLTETIIGILAGAAITAIAETHGSISSSHMEDRLNDRLSKLSNDLDVIKSEIEGMQTDLTKIESKLSGVSVQVDRIVEMMTEFVQDYETEKFKKTAVAYNTRRSKMLKVGSEAAEVYRELMLYKDNFRATGNPADSANFMKTMAYWQDNTANYRMKDALEIIDDFAEDATLNSYLDYVYDYACYIYPWEHESYNFIYQNLAEFLVNMTQAYLASQLCMLLDNNLTPEMRDYKSNQLTASFGKIDKVMKAVNEVCKQRDEEYRRCNVSSMVGKFTPTTYERKAFCYSNSNFTSFFGSNKTICFPKTDLNGTAARSTLHMANTMFSLNSGLKYMSSDQVAFIYSFSCSNLNLTRIEMRKLFEEKIGFTHDKSGGYVYFCPSSSTEFSYGDGSDNYPKCGMFSWYNCPTGPGHDWFGICTAFAPNYEDISYYQYEHGYLPAKSYAPKYTEELLVGCTISNMTGLFNDFGRTRHTLFDWFTIREISNDQGFIKDVNKVLSAQN